MAAEYTLNTKGPALLIPNEGNAAGLLLEYLADLSNQSGGLGQLVYVQHTEDAAGASRLLVKFSPSHEVTKNAETYINANL